MLADLRPVRWGGQQAVVAVPEHVDESTAGQIQDEFLSVINGGANALIADMTATISCDHAGAGAVVRTFQRAVTSCTELRLVVTAPHVSRVLSISGVDRLVPIGHGRQCARGGPRSGGQTGQTETGQALPPSRWASLAGDASRERSSNRPRWVMWLRHGLAGYGH